jgi:FkbM family methyltransferase
MNIVQIGTNKANDFLSNMVFRLNQSQISNIVLVEPFDIHNSNILECYKNYLNKVYIENVAIVPYKINGNFTKIWYHDHDFLYNINQGELSSLNREHAIKIRNNYDIKDMKSKEIECLTINELFDKYLIDTIEILYIDVEGIDDQIIYSIDFNKYKINNIYYENLHINKDSVRKYLQSKNYSICLTENMDIYSDHAKINL